MTEAQFRESQAWRDYQAALVRLQVQADLCAPPTLFSIPPVFDGSTYEQGHDEARLCGLLQRVHAALQDGCWHTLAELHAACGGSEAGISARLRDLRKTRWGAHTVERRRRSAGEHEYRLAEPCKLHRESVCLKEPNE